MQSKCWDLTGPIYHSSLNSQNVFGWQKPGLFQRDIFQEIFEAFIDRCVDKNIIFSLLFRVFCTCGLFLYNLVLMVTLIGKTFKFTYLKSSLDLEFSNGYIHDRIEIKSDFEWLKVPSSPWLLCMAVSNFDFSESLATRWKFWTSIICLIPFCFPTIPARLR